MSRIPVGSARAVPTRVAILAGEPVMAPAQWTDIALGANWMRAKGACLVPNHNPDYEIKNAAEHTFRYRIKSRSTALQRIWTVTVILQPGAGEPETASVLLKVPATVGTAVRGTARAVVAGTLATFPAQTTIIETLGSKAATEQEISISVQILTSVSGGTNTTTARVIGIQCYEQDRPSLNDDSTDQGVLIETVRHSEPIFRLANTSAYGVLQAIQAADARRVGLYHYSNPSTVSRLSATPASILSLLPYIQAPKVARGTTTTTVNYAAYGYMSSGGGSGDVILSTSVSVASSSVSFTSTTPGWSTTQSIAIACDDFSVVDGFVADLLDIQIAGDGTRSVIVEAVSVWVADVA